MKLSIESLSSQAAEWRQKGFILPGYDIAAVRRNTESLPEWVHFGAGNIFRGYIACLADELIKSGELKTGIIAADSFDTEMIDRIYKPFDELAILVGLRSQGGKYLRVIGSIADGVAAVGDSQQQLRRIACSPSLKMISFTITEKGYACTDISGGVLPAIQKDIDSGPEAELSTAVGISAMMLYERFISCGAPIALVSMDNCSRNGEKLRNGVLFMIESWQKKGYVPKEFFEYASNVDKAAFPWSMIDRITPRPDASITSELLEMGIEDIQPIITEKKTFIAPFVNAEMPQYLVIEDSFPNGRPPLEKVGVYMTDRDTVDRAERMKVMTCLNPLHTALAVFGCLLGFKKISDEMCDNDLSQLVRDLGYREGLPVVTDPGIISPEEFLKEVLEERLPNPFLPDTPQRIATDTSQKMAIRFGETIKAYAVKGETDKLELIPLVIAGWLRYLLAIDDNGEAMELSPDPMLDVLCGQLDSEWFGDPSALGGERLRDILSNSELFGIDLVKAGLAGKVEGYFAAMLDGKQAVRRTLHTALEK